MTKPFRTHFLWYQVGALNPEGNAGDPVSTPTGPIHGGVAPSMLWYNPFYFNYIYRVPVSRIRCTTDM